jgi:hypothetical protein
MIRDLHQAKETGAMNAGNRVGIALAMVMLAAGPAWAGSPERIGTGGAPELRLPVGARSVALAGSDLGTVSGAEALFYNPAGIVESKSHTELLFSHTQYIADMKLNYIAVTQAVGNGAIGVSAKVLSIGDMVYTTEAAPDGTGETFNPTYSTLGLTYARKMTDRVDFGATVLYDSEHILQETANGVSFGFGFVYDTDFHGARLGMAMNNVGPNMEYGGSDLQHLQQLPGYNPFVSPRNLGLSTSTFELPTSFQFGLSLPLIRGGQNAFAVHGAYINNSFAVDEGRVGAEYVYQKLFALRGGYKITSNSDDLFSFSYGLGLRVPLGASSMWVDYAGQPVNKYFDDVQHLSLTLEF